MNRRLKFADAFWGTDFLSTAGYDVIKKRVKDGRLTCKSFEAFLRTRAKCEEEYGKAIQRATKEIQEMPEVGTLRQALDRLRLETNSMAQDHLDNAVQFLDAANRMSDFVELQKNERKAKEIAVDKRIEEKRSLHKHCQQMKGQYRAKSMEAEQADIIHQKAKPQENSYSTKEWDKIVRKQQQTAAEAQKAKITYRESLDKLDSVRQEWERDMIDYCQTCEMLEEARIKMLHNEAWLKCNIVSVSCVYDDQHYEAVRELLEKVDMDSDIEQFILKSTTGFEKPASIKFEEYEPTSIGSHTSMLSCSANVISQPELLNSTAAQAPRRAMIPPPHFMVGGAAALSSSSGTLVPPGRPPVPQISTQLTGSTSSGTPGRPPIPQISPQLSGDQPALFIPNSSVSYSLFIFITLSFLYYFNILLNK